MASYWEQLQDPRWQRKRLEILNRANFICEWCCENEKILHVHHKYYKKGLKAWEYPNDAYLCLCERCHKQATEHKQQLDLALRDSVFIDQITGYTDGCNFDWAFSGYTDYPFRTTDLHTVQSSLHCLDGWLLGFCDALHFDQIEFLSSLPNKVTAEQFLKVATEMLAEKKKQEAIKIRKEIENE